MRDLFARPFVSSWLFDVELIARMGAAAGWDRSVLAKQISEYPLQTWLDVAGSKVKPLDFAKAGIELLQIHWQYRVRNS